MVLRHFCRRPGPASRLASVLAATSALCLPLGVALAGPVTISNSTSTALRTSAGDGQGPGNITVETNGSVTLSTGIPITVDSSNNATVNGTLRNDLANGATGLLVNTSGADGQAVNLTSTLTLGGSISIPGPSDPVAAGVAGNFGVRLTGAGSVTGNYIGNIGSQIAVGGRQSTGFAVESRLIGDFTSATAISMNGPGSFGIRTSNAITGSFALSGTVQATGQDAVGVYTGGSIGGLFSFSSSIATGQQSYFDTNGRRVDASIGGPALWLAGSVGNGVLLEGNQVPTQLESSTTVSSTAPADSVLSAEGTNFGAFRIGVGSPAGSSPITIGLRADGGTDSVVMRGRIQSSTSKAGAAVTAMAVAGGVSGSTVLPTTLLGGINNDGGNIDAVSVDASATGLQIGDYATVPYFVNRGGYLSVASTDSGQTSAGLPGNGGGTATGIVVSSTGYLGALINTGSFAVEARGKNFNSTALLDNAGGLAYFENTGTFAATVGAGSTGRTIAADLSRSTRNIDFRNSGTLTGDVTLGVGNDTFLSTAGTIKGAYDFGAGNNTVTIRNTTFTGPITLGAGNHVVTIEGGTKYTGGLARGAGTTQLTITNSDFVTAGGQRIQASTAVVTGTSKLDLAVDGQNPSVPLFDVTGTARIDSSVQLSTRLSGLVTQSETITVIRAGQLQLGIPLSQIGSTSSSYIYGFQYRLAPTNSNTLLLDVTRRTASQLGLAANLGTVYENSLTAMAADNELFSAVAASTDRASFEGIMSQLKPDSSDASLYAALRSQNLAYGVIRARLQGIPRTTGPSAGSDYSSFWVQQLGSYGKRDAEGEQPGYKIYTVGIATGFDQQFTPEIKGGMSIAQTWSLPDEINTRDRPLRIASTEVDFYGRHQNGANFTQAIFGGSYNAYRSERRVLTGTIKREPIGRWKGFNLGGAIDTGTTMRLSDFKFTPYMRASYIRTHENDYAETGGGAGVDLDYDARNQDSLRGGVGFTAERRFVVFQDVGFEASLRGDFAREFSADPANVTARFAAGGVSFTQTGQTPDKNIFGLGASLGVRDIFTSFSVDYDAEKSGDFIGHTIAATFRFRF